MAPGRSDDFLRRRSNEERAQDYRSITLCLWMPYSDHKTNSAVAIAEYKSHTLCLSMPMTPVSSFSENKKRAEGLVIYLTSSPMGAVFVCLLVFIWLLGVRV